MSTSIDDRVAAAAAWFHRASERPSASHLTQGRSFNTRGPSSKTEAASSSPQAKRKALENWATLTSRLLETAAAAAGSCSSSGIQSEEEAAAWEEEGQEGEEEEEEAEAEEEATAPRHHSSHSSLSSSSWARRSGFQRARESFWGEASSINALASTAAAWRKRKEDAAHFDTSLYKRELRRRRRLRSRRTRMLMALDEPRSSRLASGIFALLIALIILSVGLVIIDSYDPERHEWVQDATSVLRPLEYVCSVVFTLEVSAALVSL